MSFLNSLFNNVTVNTDANGIVTITGFKFNDFRYFIKKYYNSEAFVDRFIINKKFMNTTIRLYQFYLPELIFLLEKAKEKRFLSSNNTDILINMIYKNTWMKSTQQPVESIVDLKYMESMLNPGIKLLDHQLEFIRDIYYQKKTQYLLNGYLLSFSQGLGKSGTSLALGLALKKKHFVIICPLSTVTNVWVNEVHKFTKLKNIWTINDSLTSINDKVEVVIANYEAIDKISDPIQRNFNSSETIIIVDECHNFKDYKALRFNNLYNFCKEFKCKDILLMSGTPIKALGVECIPIFKLLDSFFTDSVEKELIALNRYINIMNDLLRNRLGMIMFRKLKEEVLTLPPKFEEELKVQIPNGNRFTLENVKKLVIKYKEERQTYYKQNYSKFYNEYNNCLNIFSKTLRNDSYKRDVRDIVDIGPSAEISEIIIRANIYEKEVIIPNLPSNLRQVFRNAKSVVKYVDLKILGEVLGNLLGKLRIEMTSEMIDQPKIFEIIRDAQKKTILFSSYTDSIKIAYDICKKYKFDPLMITGDNTKEATSIVDKFKRDPKINPLIASLKVMSTGHTITEANTVIFLNVPFRSVDYDQASDRVYRVGQDVPVYIYKLVLDTGNLPNLSTRMNDIISWSKDAFNAIVGDEVTNNVANEGIFINNNDYIKIFNEIESIDDPKINLYLEAIDKKINSIF